jgi:hypothetical protein
MGRISRGSPLSAFYGDTMPDISKRDSAFQLQEYISAMVKLDPHDVERIVALPYKDKDSTVDQACWIYEQLR